MSESGQETPFAGARLGGIVPCDSSARDRKSADEAGVTTRTDRQPSGARPPSSAPAGQDPAENIFLLNRWIKAAVALLAADAGIIVVADGGGTRVIARHNVPHAFIATSTQVEDLPHALDETVVIRDATDRADLHTMLGDCALDRTGFFYRRPLALDTERSIALLIYARTPRINLSDRELVLVDELADAIATEVERYYPPSGAPLTASMGLTRAGLAAWLAATASPAAVFDAALALAAVNPRLTSLFPRRGPVPLRRHLTDIGLPADQSLDFLFRHALETGVSTPRIEVVIADAESPAASPRCLQVVGSPVRLLDADDPVLVVTLDDITERVNTRSDPDARAPSGGSGARATVDFLLETLVQRRALRSRKGVSFITLRAWRQPIRAHQIRALKAIKRSAPAAIAAEVAEELHADLAALFGAAAFRAVIPVPCGHSSARGCLSHAIALELGQRINLPVIAALAMPPLAGSSHPKTNARRPPMTLQRAIEGPVLLVDDVATSGRHIEEACQLLRAGAGSVLAMAWIGGDVTNDEDDAGV